MAPLHDACFEGDTELVRRLLNEGAPLDEKGGPFGWTALMLAIEIGHTEVVELLLGKGAPVDEKDEDGGTALTRAGWNGHTEVVKLLLDAVVKLRLENGASLLEQDAGGMTLLMRASMHGHTEVVELLLSKGAPVNEKDEGGWTALMHASENGHTEVVGLLLGKGAPIDEQDENGRTALTRAGWKGRTEVVKLLLGKGAAIDEKDEDGRTALLLAFVKFDEEHLGRMAAAQVHRQLLRQDTATLDATATAVFQLVQLAGFARERALTLRSSDPHSADDHQVLFGRLQLAAAACIQNDESGKDRDEKVHEWQEKDAHKLLRYKNGRKALEHAVQIEAKELLAQPVVQGYMMVAWRGRFDFSDVRWLWGPFIVFSLLFVLLQLVIFLPLVTLVPPLEPRIESWLNKRPTLAGNLDQIVAGSEFYVLHLPVVKFGLECTADLALALALTLVPATDLATAPVAPLLLAWVVGGLLREAHQVMALSIDATSRLDRMYDRLAAYWADSINRVDATALMLSFAALVAFMSTDSENTTATSLRTVAVLLLWLRAIRLLLISPKFGPFVMMFFRMLFGDVFYFMVLLFFVLVAFAASWTVLLEPKPVLLAQQFGDGQNWRWTPSYAAHLETAGCADELGGLDFFSTLRTLFEGALTGSDFFECARDSTNSPLAAWAISFAFVTLTSVLLLNMLIAMMAKTFDNISEASATNYLFLFAQRTLALQNEPTTPPPLNLPGLPCKAVYMLWKLYTPHHKELGPGRG